MPKRFTSTEIWEEDWFLAMPNHYKLFWYYMLSNCDHAGLFKVNVRSFNGLLEVSVSSKEALAMFNTDKQRIREITESVWLIEDFFVFQYGTTFNVNNNLHSSIGKLYDRQKISLTSLRGLLDLKDTPKDKVKDKEINNNGQKKLKGESFSEDFTKVVFPDGSTQRLGESQAKRIKSNDIQPSEIYKGQIV